ncbi:uncharacterized protein SPPG_08229 [Spizellomyces punctatus DAOM BR117]|uniref:SH3 domain-containing protein n=1 Tax=Spizellomyces punctatus (strain DAOM BR117) TaxID=645134 RepID=A0A0L0H6G4_SPIPD|nr:uncharacterized protein SPPG_08229 [Spizellomyces punctatus DAOM BR117]KNC96323.1 hypothetical protein SPPG_08229 [Spizellomyces punctatus DAOM BR117]|eukprot:XP_016604363.1 hypothetical protein SPPG_08229 [Spizellomyces punctatus DAOM BR117]
MGIYITFLIGWITLWSVRAQQNLSVEVPFRWGHVGIGVQGRVMVVGGVETVVEDVNEVFPVSTVPTLFYTPSTSTLTVLSTSGTFPPSIGHACTFIETDGGVYCMGGYEGTAPALAPRSRRGVWRFSLQKGDWSVVAVNGFFNTFGGVEDDTGVADGQVVFINRSLVLVGGRGSCWSCGAVGTGETAVQGTISLLDGTQVRVVHEPAGGLYGHCTVQVNNNVYTLFGNTTTNGGNNQTWVLGLGTTPPVISSLLLLPIGFSPPVRLFPTCTVNGNTIIVTGGISPNGTYLTDTWVLNLSTLVWTSMPVTGLIPPPRIRPALFQLGNGVIGLQGGLRRDRVVDTGLYALDTRTRRWEQVVISRLETPLPTPPIREPEGTSKWLTIGLPIVVAITAISVLILAIGLWRFWIRYRNDHTIEPRQDDHTSKPPPSPSRDSVITVQPTIPPFPDRHLSPVPQPLYTLPNDPLQSLPQPRHPINLTKPYTAAHEHTPTRPDETLVTPSDTLTIRKVYKDGWCVGMNVTTRTGGYFPVGVVNSREWETSSMHSRQSDETSNSTSTLCSPPDGVLKVLEELDWALETGVLDLETYFGRRKRVFFSIGWG